MNVFRMPVCLRVGEIYDHVNSESAIPNETKLRKHTTGDEGKKLKPSPLEAENAEKQNFDKYFNFDIYENKITISQYTQSTCSRTGTHTYIYNVINI